MTTHRSDPSVTQQVKFDAICLQFEQAWRQGQGPTIESHLERLLEAERPLVLHQLLLVEFEYLQEAGEPPELDKYLERFPNDDAVVRRALNEHAAALASGSPSESIPHAPTLDYHSVPEGPGSQIGRYKLLEQIGEGGMGVVYMAEQQQPVRRKVALKIIKPGMDTKQIVARFEAERQALAMMDHPNIARVLDAGTTDSRRSLSDRSAHEFATFERAIGDAGRPYFVMELVRGMPITEFCDQNRYDTEQRLKLFKLVCHAVQHAHTKGIIHRDLKPTNVLVTLHDSVPVPKIIDFGISKAMGQQLTEKTLFTAFTQMVGTPLYMSPEQAEMSGLDIDTRSDIYSLGVLLYELLTGSTPFDSKRLVTAGFDEMRRIIREEEPEKPSTRVSTIGQANVTACEQRSTDATKLKQLLRGDLDWIAMKTLEKDRNRRYETANALAAEVDRYLAGEPVAASPPSATYRLRKFVRRHKTPAAVASLFLLLMVASTVVGWVLFADARRAENLASHKTAEAVEARQRAEDAKTEIQTQKDLAEKNLVLARTQEQKAAGLAEELQRRLYDYNLSRAVVAHREDDSSTAGALLTNCLPDQRRWEWHWLNRLIRGQRRIQLSGPPIVRADLSPVASHGAAVDEDANLRLFDLADGRTIWTHPTKLTRGAFVAFSPTGDLITVYPALNLPPARVELWETSGRLLWSTESDSEAITWVAISNDDRYLALATYNPTTHAREIVLYKPGSPTPLWRRPCRGLTFFVFDRTCEHLFLSSLQRKGGRSTISCWNLNDEHVVWSHQRENMPEILCLSPDDLVLTGGERHTLEVRDPATGNIIEVLQSTASDEIMAARSSPNGSHVMTIGYSGEVVLWDWSSRTENPALRFSVEPMEFLSFTHDDRYILSSQSDDLNVELKSVQPAPATLVLSGHEGAVRGVAFTPDGKRVLSAGFDGTVRTWDTTSGQELRIQHVPHSLMAIDYSGTGDHFATAGEEAVSLWNAQNGELIHQWPTAILVRSLQFSPDGQRLLAGTIKQGQGLKLFDVAGRHELLQRETPGMKGAVFSGDGQRVVSLTYFSGKLHIFDPESSNDPISVRPADEGDHGFALLRIPRALPAGNSQSGSSEPGSRETSSCLVAAAIVSEFTVGGSPIEIWDVDTKQPVMALRGHDGWVTCLAVNRDGTRLFSGDVKGVVIVWNLETGEQLFSLHAHEPREVPNWGMLRGVMSLILSPDEKTLATTGADGLVKLWETTHPSPAAIEQRSIVREATAAVNQQFARTSLRRAVLESLTNDSSLDPETLKVALDLAQLRGDYIDSLRIPLLEAIEAAAGIDFDDPEKPPTVFSGRWVWDGYRLTDPAQSPVPLARMVELLAPDHSGPHAHYLAYVRANANARLGQWQKADEDLARALAAAPEKSQLWVRYAYRYAFLLAHRQQWDRYHQFCREAITEVGDVKHSLTQEQLSLMCLFSSNAEWDAEQLEQLVQLADEAHERGHPYPPQQAKSALTKAIATLRRGDFVSAIDLLAEAAQAYDGIDREPPVVMHLYRAIAHAHLGQQQEAQTALQTATDKLNAETPRSASGGYYMWWEWMINQIVRREAETLVKSLQ